jgi:two-component system NarL family response regulator
MADAHPPTRQGVRLALEAAGLAVCAEAGDADEAALAATREQPTICLIDVDLPGGGIALAEQITSKHPRCAVVMFAGQRDDRQLLDALRAGAVGYLPKDTDPERLPVALGRVLEGEAALPRSLVPVLLEEFRERRQRRRLPLVEDRAVELTSREWEVLDLLRDGLGTSEIADRLFISQVTVRTHIASVLHKLGAPDRQAALSLLEDR